MSTLEGRVKALEKENKSLERRLLGASASRIVMPRSYFTAIAQADTRQKNMEILMNFIRAKNADTVDQQVHVLHPECLMIKNNQEMTGIAQIWVGW